MSNEYGAIPLSTANAVGASLKKKMGSLTGFAPVDWAETINKLGNKLPERTVSGAVCTFADGADDVPMPSVKASITAVQAGSGDPSPSNVRAISGFAECDVTHTGANVFDKSNLTWNKWYNSDGSLVANARYGVMSKMLRCERPKTIFVNCAVKPNSFAIVFFDKKGNFLFRVFNNSSTRQAEIPPSDAYWVIIQLSCVTSEDITQAYIDNIGMMVSIGTEVSTYESYAGETIPVWMGGINLWGGSVMLDSFKSAGISGLTYDDSTLTYTALSISTKVVPTIQYKENTQYTFIFSMSNNLAYDATNLRVYYTDGTNTIIVLPSASAGTKQTVVFTTALGKTVDRIQGVNSAGTITLYYNESGLFEGVKTAQDFEPCRYIYGGELNLTTGVLTVTHGMQTYDGDEGWHRYTAGSAGQFAMYAPLTGMPSLISNVNQVQTNYLKTILTNSTWGNFDNWITKPNNQNYIITGIQSITDLNDWKRYLGEHPLTVMYELATPTTIQLTPEEVRSFLGTNNLWANTGDSEATYYAQPNVPTEVLYKGQISTTSDYATANFTESVEDDEEILVKVYCPARSAVDYKVIKVADIGNGLNVGFSLHTTVNCTITKTSIASYQYSSDYYDIYADVLAYDSAIFN